MSVSKKKIFFIYGLGISGLSAALFLKKESFSIFCWDDNSKKRVNAKQKKLNIKNYNSLDFSKIDYVITSPIINHRLRDVSPIIQKSKKNKVKLISDLELLEIFKKKNLKIGVTGTNGKSTTTKFIQLSLLSKTQRTIACGNFGLPIGDVIKKTNNNDIFVVEASSFQLDKLDKLKFDISILLNISKDHIDWHGNFKNYKDSKIKIFNNQDKNCFSIICIDDSTCKKIALNFNKKFSSKLIKISTKQKLKDGIYLEYQKEGIVIVNNLNNEKIFFDYRMIMFAKVKHNFENFLATYAVNFLLKKNEKQFKNSSKKLFSLEHRLELVGNLKNIFFYNDSKATNIESSRNALKSFKNIYWILGGRKKLGGLDGIDSSLKNVEYAFSFGEAGKEFKEYLTKKGIKSICFKKLESVLLAAVKKALNEKRNINIIFSPACSSFDQYKNFEQRGNKFKTLVNGIIKSAR
jgi:UDP-N-acetylmuramoylalanine--D-glutamate ligase